MCTHVIEKKINLEKKLSWAEEPTPLTPAFLRQRQVDLCTSKASLVYIARSSTVRIIYRDPVSKI